MRLTSPFTRQPLLGCCSFSHKHGGFQFPRRLSHPDKRRHFHELRSQRTCAARRIRLLRMRLAGAGRRAAQVGGRFSEVRRLARRRLRKVRKTRRFGGDFEDASIEKAAAAAEEGRGERFAADKPFREAAAFGLLFFLTQARRLSISPPPLPPRQTPPFPRAAQSAHLRGAPHTAKPYAAGGGAAAAPCRPALAGAGRRAAQVGGWFSEVRQLARRRLRKVRKTRRFGGDFEDASIEKAAAAAEEGARRTLCG